MATDNDDWDYPLHGGDLAWADANFPRAPRPWIDCSTGINPWPYAACNVRWDRLPQGASLAALLAAARRYYRIAPDNEIAAVAGVELAIRCLPHLLNGKRNVAIIGPTYSSHADAWMSAGRSVSMIAAAASLSEDHDVCVVVSPNNPDGHAIGRNALAALAEKMGRKGGIVIADRSFADVSDDPDALPPAPGLIELRSFGKFFGLPGLRLGFAIGNIEPLRHLLGAWPLNAAALETGRVALDDADWHAATRSKLKAARRALDTVLERHGTIIGGTDLFCLLHVADGVRLFRHLASRGILTRIFDYDPSRIRFGLPPDEAGLVRLARALNEFPETRR